MRYIVLLLLLSACTERGLMVRLEGLKRSYLASYKVETPDPRSCSFCGQQLVVTWNAPHCHTPIPPMHLTISLITGSHQFEKFTVPVYTRSGTYVYRLLGPQYRKKLGILSYKAELFEQNRLLYCWKLPTFVDWINPEKD